MTKQAPGDEINLPAVATSLLGILRFILVRNKTDSRPLCIVGHGRGGSEATPRSVTPAPQLSLDQSVDTPRRASEGVGGGVLAHASRLETDRAETDRNRCWFDRSSGKSAVVKTVVSETVGNICLLLLNYSNRFA